jgi:predicted nucleic acid-binding protein
MKKIVLDCSVVVPWFFPEDNNKYSFSVLESIKGGECSGIAPELLLAEFASVAFKKVARGLCSLDYSKDQFREFVRMPIRYYSISDSIQQAYLLATGENISVYDGLYLCLALGLGIEIATADKLMRRIAKKMKIGLKE